MKKISLWLLIFLFTAFIAGIARAQDSATQQQIDQINGRLQDIEAAQVSQAKHIEALEKEISDLRDKLNQPAVADSASADDLKKLAAQVQELAKKQQDDNDLILKEFEKLGKSGGVSTTSRKPPDVSTPTADNSNGSDKQNGYYYEVQSGNTLSAIVKAYRDQKPPIKVTVDQILKANPGLNPNNLIVGKKIFIPAPQQ